MNLEVEIVKTPDDYDSNNVYFYLPNTRVRRGFAYQSKKTGIIYIRKCPSCLRENYAIQEGKDGRCAWCGFDPNASTTVDKRR